MRHLALLLLLATATLAADVGLVNGSFEDDADDDGVPDGWTTSGGGSVQQKLGRERTADGTWCAILECTAFESTGPDSHAMLAQYDTISLEKGKWYRFQVRLRGRGVPGGSVSIAISNTKRWSNCGLSDSAFLSQDWLLHETVFQATQTISDGLRLQLWWGSTGTVWFDDVALEETEAPQRRYTERIAPVEARNKVPNGGFEAGPAGWGSVTDISGWGGNLSRLVGEVVDEGPHSGQRCLKIALTPETTPMVWFDYYGMLSQPVRMPLAANRGWIPVEPGRTYTLSAWLRADPPGLTAVLRARQTRGGRPETRVQATAEWARHSLTFQARADQLYVCVGPDLAADDRDRGTLWVDDVMLEEGGTAGDWEPRAEVRLGFRLGADGGLFEPGQPVLVNGFVASHAQGSRSVTIAYRVTDFYDEEVRSERRTVEVAPGAGSFDITIRDLPRGFYRLTIEAEGAEVTPPLPLRLAVIPGNRRDDTVCGMNHGYPTQDLLDLSKRIGLGWFRDWSFKWNDVEPDKGRFDFARADAQVDRVLARGLRVLALLPFPSAAWSSSGPPVAENASYRQSREFVAYAPKNPADLATYVRRTAEHLSGRIDTFEIFNEPVYTTYSLPKRFGYQVEDYARLLALCAAAVREGQPGAKVIGGIQAGPSTLTKELIGAGGLEHIDALSLHSYPGKSAPEAMVPAFEALRQRMADAGHADLPLWWTEGAYYADDDPSYRPYTSWLRELPTERLCAAFTIRLNAILCGYGTRRIIYHSGTPGAINEETLSGIYFEYDGLPRKMTPALATFNEWIGPDVRTRGRVAAGEGVYAYVFDSGGKSVAIAWSPMQPFDANVDRATWTALDLLGNPLPPGPVTLSAEPVYLVAGRTGLTPAF